MLTPSPTPTPDNAGVALCLLHLQVEPEAGHSETLRDSPKPHGK